VLDFVIYRIEGEKRIEVKTIKPQVVWLSFPNPAPRQIKPGESWSVKVDLEPWLLKSTYVGQEAVNPSGHLTSGDYEISAIYDISNLTRLFGVERTSGFVHGRYTSQPIAVTVR